MKRPYRTTGQITHRLELDEPEPSYVECVYAIDYQVTPYWVEGQRNNEPEVLSVTLLAAAAYIHDCGVEVPCGDAAFCKAAVQRFTDWMAEKSNHREKIHALILEDYETQEQLAESRWS